MSLSGRYPEHDICEDFNAIDVRELQRKTQMRPGLCFIKEWFRNGAPAGEVSIFIHPDAVILVHRARFPGSTESRIIELQVPIIWTKCHLGGRRPWFKCQTIINGEVCGRRVAKLYAPCFECRRCLGLGYESQREIPLRRAERRAQKIKMRLGNEPWRVSRKTSAMRLGEEQRPFGAVSAKAAPHALANLSAAARPGERRHG
jgi:hypothetical protein